MPKKLRIGLLFGGKSGEHEVSLQSAKSIYEALDKNKYDVFLIGIDKQGRWLLGESSTFLLNSNDPKHISLNNHAPEIIPIQKSGAVALMTLNDVSTGSPIDVFFPIIHGTYGEDGSLQGFLELLNTAYVGAGVLGSAIGMDKDVMKRLLKEAGIPVAKWHAFSRSSLEKTNLKEVIHDLHFPIFVKPANLGSSVGVSKAHNEMELQKAIDEAFQYDTKILLEEFIEGREIECSVLGNEDPIASVPGEIMPTHEFYSYDAKYIDEHGAKLQIPAKLSDELIQKIQHTAINTFKTLECSGMARVDFFLKKNEDILVNEINTLPGFTSISMYPKLWEASGISYRDLLDRLIQLALDKKKQKDALKRTFR